jgi:hypothetical protein
MHGKIRVSFQSVGFGTVIREHAYPNAASNENIAACNVERAVDRPLQVVSELNDSLAPFDARNQEHKFVSSKTRQRT